MIRVLSPQRITQAEALTMQVQGISALQLMERAASLCSERIRTWVPNGDLVVIAGKGNNGGDGLAMARLLHAEGRIIRVFRVLDGGKPSPENDLNYQAALSAGVACSDLREIEQLDLSDHEVVIDALLGTGVDRSPAGLIAAAIHRINEHPGKVVSIDMPSGLQAERRIEDPALVVQADLVLCLGAAKLALLLPENARYAKEWAFLPLDLEDLPKVDRTPMAIVEREDVAKLVKDRPRAGHKGTFGHVLLIAGGPGHLGAAVLATRAALKSGCGLVTAYVPKGGAVVMHAAAPEAMCKEDRDGMITELPERGPYDAFGVGPGMGLGSGTIDVVSGLLEDPGTSVVLDADAINALAQDQALRRQLRPGVILTPHPKEFDRLVGTPSGSGFERLDRAREFAQEHRCVVVLKGVYTATCSADGQVRFNDTGNCGMAKGGSGDALTGLITGLLAQGYSPEHAATLGVHLHGAAGDLAANDLGMDGMTVSDLVDRIPLAWKQLRVLQKRSTMDPLP